ncbi:MAG: hypothetical protein KA175_10640 [Flavobacteriales bacterium]|nr:hypothetical protein [Flavobacteriales bacterium]MBP6698066.1 hypothetical protein [Flavobacteriales bacterium]
MKQGIALLILCLGLQVSAQTTPASIAKTKDLVFFGLDFTFLKLIHEDGFVDKNGKPMCKTLPFKYFVEWNEMFLIERAKFNLSDYFGVKNYTIDQATVSERNKAYVTEGCILASSSYRIGEGELEEAIKAYSSAKGSGVGCVIFAESFNKTDTKAVIYTVFFDLADHTVLLIDEEYGTPVGQGFRNFWVNAIHMALEKGAKAYKH